MSSIVLVVRRPGIKSLSIEQLAMQTPTSLGNGGHFPDFGLASSNNT
jgi:hypothetical protein